MKTIIAAALAVATLSACVAVPTDPAELAAYRAENTARTASRAKAPGSIVAGTATTPTTTTQREIEYLKAMFPSPVAGDTY